MSKFNKSTKEKVTLTTNNCGVDAYSMKDKDLLISQVLTSFFNEKKYYGDNSNELVKVARRVIEKDPQFVANLALYARNEMNMRTTSHVLMAELSHSQNGKKYARETIKKGTVRVDDMTEILSYYNANFGKPFSNSLKKGLADSFLKFNEYSLAKYNRANKDFTLKDILCLTHPTPTSQEQSGMFKRVLENTLETPKTWETQLSTRGNTKEVWEELISERKLGYMAMLRNMRNILNAGVENINDVYKFLSNEERVLRSRQLPFRFYSAYKELKNVNGTTSRTLDTLENAMKLSTQNIKKLEGKTLIAIDTSGSMGCSISNNSTVSCEDIAKVIGSIGNYICEDSIIVTFDTSLKTVTLPSSNGIISNAMGISAMGGGTDLTLPLEYLINNKINVDRIIMISDNEMNRGFERARYSYFSSNKNSTSCQDLLNKYKSNINKDVWFHAIDLQGYGTQQFKGNKVNLIAGWSEKVFDFMALAENGTSNLVKTISNHHLT